MARKWEKIVLRKWVKGGWYYYVTARKWDDNLHRHVYANETNKE